MNQTQLAKLVGLTPSHLNKIECKNGIPKVQTLLRIREVLNVSMDDLFEGVSLGRPLAAAPDPIMAEEEAKISTLHPALTTNDDAEELPF